MFRIPQFLWEKTNGGEALRGAIHTEHCKLGVKLTLGRWGSGSLTLRKRRLGIFVIGIQTKDGIFESVQKVIRNFVVKVNLNRPRLMEPSSLG